MQCFLLVVLMMGGALEGSLYAQDTYRSAYDAGYADAVEIGRNDRENGRPFDFANKKDYQMGDRGFDSAVHDFDVYVVAYRRGFEDGYEAGYGLTDEPADRPQSAPVIRTSTIDPADGGPADVLSGDVTLEAGTELDVKLLDTLSTNRNERGDRFRAEVTRDIRAGGQLVIPRGTRLEGTVTHSKRAGRIKGRAEMNLLFNELEFASGSRVPIHGVVSSIEERADEEVKDEEGKIEGGGSKSGDLKKVGISAGIGALLGILTGGKSGAKTGAGVGAVVGLAGVLATRGKDVVLYPETEMRVKLENEVTIPGGVDLRRP